MYISLNGLAVHFSAVFVFYFLRATFTGGNNPPQVLYSGRGSPFPYMGNLSFSKGHIGVGRSFDCGALFGTAPKTRYMRSARRS